MIALIIFLLFFMPACLVSGEHMSLAPIASFIALCMIGLCIEIATLGF